MSNPRFDRRVPSTNGRYLLPLYSDVLSSKSQTHLDRGSEPAYDITAHPERTEMYPIADGTVYSVERLDYPSQTTPSGYGENVLIDHGNLFCWYCHLEFGSIRGDIQKGTRLRQGETFARVGATGYTLFPKHTHITMFRAIGNYTRIWPETIWPVDDLCWMPYAHSSDLAHYELEEPMKLAGKLLGPHIIGGVDRSLAGNYIPDVLQQWQPRMILVMKPNRNDTSILRNRCPNAAIVQRYYRDDSDVAGRIFDNPKAAAAWSHHIVMNEGHLIDSMMFGQVENEVGEKNWQHLDKLIDYGHECIRLANRDGIKRCLFNFSVGHVDMPEHDRMSWWRQFYPVMREMQAGGHLFGVHQYGGNNFFNPNGGAWTSGRLENQVIPRLPDDLKGVKFGVTELGVSNIGWKTESGDYVIADKGWRGGNSYNGNAQAYVGDMQRHMDWVVEKGLDSQILGYAVFTWGRESDHWKMNDIEGECARVCAQTGRKLPIVDFNMWMDASGTTPPPPEEQVLYQARITTAKLNVRSGPGVSFPKVGQVSLNNIVDVLKDEDMVNGVPWWMIHYENLVGYASSTYMGRIQPPPPNTTLEERVTELESQITMVVDEMIEMRRDVDNQAAMLVLLGQRVADLENATPPIIPPSNAILSPAIDYMNMSLVSGLPLKLRDVFTTHDGSWDVSSSNFSITQHARDRYLRHTTGAAGGGGSNHIFAAVVDRNGEFVTGIPILFERTSASGATVYHSEIHSTGQYGWVNLPIEGNGSFWRVVPSAGGDTMTPYALPHADGTMPGKHHVSLFCVWTLE